MEGFLQDFPTLGKQQHCGFFQTLEKQLKQL